MSLYHILYVDNPAASAVFYQRLFGRPPLESSPTFALFMLQEGFKLGLWSRHTVEPAASGGPGGAELALALNTPEEVDARHAKWQELGIEILQPPADSDFGRTFVGADPDGHRLRILWVKPE